MTQASQQNGHGLIGRLHATRPISFILEDHRFVLLGTSVLAICGLALGAAPARSMSFLAALPALAVLLALIEAAWIVASLSIGIYKLTHWKSYSKTSPFVSPAGRKAQRLASYVVWGAVLLVAIDRLVLGGIDLVLVSIALPGAPVGAIPAAIYMVSRSSGIYLSGVRNTILLALFGTILAFFLALLLVFLRIQKIDRSDNYLIRFFKVVGNKIAALYSTIIRGTPMMVQGMIIYYGGFNIVRAITGLDTAAIQQVYSFFTAGLLTVTICSAAYIAEVLRASIEAIDPGQMEAARSLGLTQWQAMSMIVFPQGVKNAIPALSNELIINIKDSSVLSVIGVYDLMYATNAVVGIYLRQVEADLVAAIIYLILTLLAGKVLDLAMQHLGMSTRHAGTSAAEITEMQMGA